jgi:hypothetical protein
VSSLLLGPQLVQIAPRHPTKLRMSQLEIGGRVERVGAAPVAVDHLVKECDCHFR